jgi:hypothetical protein
MAELPVVSGIEPVNALSPLSCLRVRSIFPFLASYKSSAAAIRLFFAIFAPFCGNQFPVFLTACPVRPGD